MFVTMWDTGVEGSSDHLRPFTGCPETPDALQASQGGAALCVDFPLTPGSRIAWYSVFRSRGGIGL